MMNISAKWTAMAVSKQWGGRKLIRNLEVSSGASDDQQHIRAGNRQLKEVGVPQALWAMCNG